MKKESTAALESTTFKLNGTEPSLVSLLTLALTRLKLSKRAVVKKLDAYRQFSMLAC